MTPGGVEPAVAGVKGRRASAAPWGQSPWSDSNRLPPDYKTGVLPVAPQGQEPSPGIEPGPREYETRAPPFALRGQTA